MQNSGRYRRIVLALAYILLNACASTSDHMPTMSDMNVVDKNSDYALVRLGTGQSYRDLAHVFLGDVGEQWQLAEINASGTPRAGQVVAVPLKATNVTGVYADGYRTLPILCYHQFTSKPEASHQLELSAQVFEAQLRYLLDNDYVILSFADAQAILRDGRPIPEKATVITIDDGYGSVYDVAWPILKKYNVPATLFIYTDFIGAPAAMTWEEISEMASSGFVEVESHGKSHTSLARLPEDKSTSAYTTRLRTELKGSNKVFEQKLGTPARFLSYPYGNSSDLAATVAREEGFQLAATVTRGDNTSFADPYLLHRTMIYDSHDLDDFKKLLRVFRGKNLQ
jgi:peptidoglycan/xylan/chitin deacetylase (PgdA/CDA1 family)